MDHLKRQIAKCLESPSAKLLKKKKKKSHPVPKLQSSSLTHEGSMNRLLNNLNQKIPIYSIVIPDELSDEPLLETLVEISKENPYYVKTFLHNLFKTGIDQDEFFELFSEVINSRPKEVTDTDIIKYDINGTSVKIRETPRIISGSGTTGLRTWEAALYLSLYFSENLEILQNESVLELGTGTGLVSLYLLKENRLQLKDLVVTDGDSSLIESLAFNFQLNQIPMESVKCHPLWWGRDQVPSSLDTIIAADVTYDSEVIPSLVECIKQGLGQGVKRAFIAATIRNEDTIKVFEDTIVKEGLKYDIVRKVVTPGELDETVWFSKLTQEIRIYKIEAIA